MYLKLVSAILVRGSSKCQNILHTLKFGESPGPQGLLFRLYTYDHSKIIFDLLPVSSKSIKKWWQSYKNECTPDVLRWTQFCIGSPMDWSSNCKMPPSVMQVLFGWFAQIGLKICRMMSSTLLNHKNKAHLLQKITSPSNINNWISLNLICIPKCKALDLYLFLVIYCSF